MLPAYPYTDELVARQAEIYRQVFAAAREYSDVIDDVTTWRSQMTSTGLTAGSVRAATITRCFLL